jgi:hypothetical protein
MTAAPSLGPEGLHRDLLVRMLGSQAGVTADGATYVPTDGTTLELLLKSGGGGPASFGRLDRLTLDTDFVSAAAADAVTLLPYAAIAGVRISYREKSRGAGFTR